MSIFSFEGPQGTGKTTAAISLAIEEHLRNGKKIISNNHLNGVPYEHFDMAFFVNNMAGEDSALEDCVLVLDEAYQYTDSRMTQSKKNILMTYFFVQTRKRGVDLYLATHHIENIDVRLRRSIDVRGACAYFPDLNAKQEPTCNRCHGDKSFKERARKERKKVSCNNCSGSGSITLSEVLCSTCNGTGTESGWVKETCKVCQGTGYWNYAMCSYCYGTGVYQGMVDRLCSVCEGTRVVDQADVECSNCKGKGVLTKEEVVGEGEPCQRCYGYGVAGYGKVYFLKVRGRGKRRFTAEIDSPRYWKYFSTRERMPIQTKLLTGIDTSEVL